MALSDNKLKIQELIDTINALPGTGGGGGGLPIGFSALKAGTFTPPVDTGTGGEPIQVWHNMGVVPNYIFVFDTFDYSETTDTNAVTTVTLDAKPYYGEYMYSPNWEYRYFNSEGLVDYSATSYEYGMDYSFDINESFFNLYPAMGSDYGWFKAGHTYRWIAAVIDGIN